MPYRRISSCRSSDCGEHLAIECDSRSQEWDSQQAARAVALGTVSIVVQHLYKQKLCLLHFAIKQGVADYHCSYRSTSDVHVLLHDFGSGTN